MRLAASFISYEIRTQVRSLRFRAFAGLYVLASATIGVVLMKESKRLGRMLRPAVALE